MNGTSRSTCSLMLKSCHRSVPTGYCNRPRLESSRRLASGEPNRRARLVFVQVGFASKAEVDLSSARHHTWSINVYHLASEAYIFISSYANVCYMLLLKSNPILKCLKPIQLDSTRIVPLHQFLQNLTKLWYCDELGTSMSNVLTLSHSSGCATSLALHSFHSTRRTLDKNVAKTPSQSVCFIPSYFQYSELVTQVNFWTFLQSWHIGFKGPKLTIESLCEMANPDRAGHLRPKSLLK